MIGRREFITLLGGARGVAARGAGAAAGGRTRKVGVLHPGQGCGCECAYHRNP